MNGDTALIDLYHRFARSQDVYLDTILCDPELRDSFVEQLQSKLGGRPEAELLARLVHLRKRGLLGRRKAH
jgi:hypothetical protein